MLRYRPTEIRLTSQDVDDTTKRLASRRAAVNTRSTVCQLPDSASTGPRLRRGPERSCDESITHSDTSHTSQFTASLDSAVDPVERASTASKVLQDSRSQEPGSSPSYLSSSSAADDISYTSEPELPRKSVPLEDVDQRVLQRTSLSPKDHYRGAAETNPPLLQVDGPSDLAARGSARVGEAPTYDAALQASPQAKASEQRTQYPSARFATEIAAQPSVALHQFRSPDPHSQAEAQGHHGGSGHSDSGPPFQYYIATSTGTHRGLPVWYNAKEVKSRPRDSVMDVSFDMMHMREALEKDVSLRHDRVPSIRLPSPASTHTSPDSERKHHSLPTLTDFSPVRRVSRPPSVSQASDHSSRHFLQPYDIHLRTASTPDLLRPLLGPHSAPSTSSQRACGATTADNSPTTSAAMLELIRQDSSPLERLEQETRSQISRAPSARLTSATAASSRSQSPVFGELRMPTFESPERPSPHRRRAARYRNVPTFAEIPNAPFSNSFDLLPAFEYSPPSLQPGTFIERYPGSNATAAGRRRGSGTGQGATSMPSLPASRPLRRRNSGHGSHAPAQIPRNTHLSTTNAHWSRVRGGSGDDALEFRRNTVGGQQRLRRYRSTSARVLPPWQDEQENSGRAERMAVMAQIQERRRYVEQTNNGRLDRTPPSLRGFESTLFQH
ncbi:hypothetical protein MPH_12818 [Macrophomina phaseolina MS6]|uniref:Uncharacterized protein n=1 Tax=Macrophomina phaseolina (strain MS6) TaxID=1126212 RepID=K2RB80_MACPH|nr:hypothetical protein MPH_12818 [Macrophomina phaseolina MS6]